MENKKSNVIIVILVLIILGLSGFIIYDKFIKQQPKPKPEPEPKISEPEVSKHEENLDEIAEILINKLEKYNIDYYDKTQNYDFNNLDDTEISKGAFVYSENKDNNIRQNIEDYYLNLFGKKLSEYPNIECHAGDGIIYKYDASTNEYVKDCGNTDACHAHGGNCTKKSIVIYYNNIEKENNNYIITTTKAYGPYQGMCFESPENAFYADSTYTIKLNDLSQFTRTDTNGNWATPDKEGAKNYYKQNYDKFKETKPYYKYTFEKVNNDYYLKKLETIN